MGYFFLPVPGDLRMREHKISPGSLFLVSSVGPTVMAQGAACCDLSKGRCLNMFPVLGFTCEVLNALVGSCSLI